MVRAAALLLVTSAALAVGGCFVLLKMPGMVVEMSELSVSGVQYNRYEG